MLPSLAHPFLNGPTNWISSISCFYAVSDESLRPRKDLLRANKTQIVDVIRRYHNFAPFVRQIGERKAQTCANAMLRHRSSRGIKRSRNGPRSKQGLEVSNARNTKSAAAHSQLRMLFSKSKVKR